MHIPSLWVLDNSYLHHFQLWRTTTFLGVHMISIKYLQTILKMHRELWEPKSYSWTKPIFNSIPNLSGFVQASSKIGTVNKAYFDTKNPRNFHRIITMDALLVI